jgi:DNA adenine methylase
MTVATPGIPTAPILPVSGHNDPRSSLRTPHSAILRPPLKWAGGKRWLVPRLRELWEPLRERRLVEPFAGGLAVALGLQPARATLNDINPHTIHFYRWLQRGLIIDREPQNDPNAYYEARERFNALIAAGAADGREAAALFYYLNRTGYNGLCRFNRRGQFNVPFGRHANINYITDFTAYRAAFANWAFTHGDFADLALEPDAVVYADPPYDVEFTQYSAGGFGWPDQERLAQWLARHPGPVLLSNQATERIVDLYERLGFTLEYHAAPRMISRNGDRTRAREVLATKNVLEREA